MFVFGQMKGLSKAEEETVEYWFEIGNQGWWNKKYRNFLKEWLKKFSLSFVLHKPKLLILTSLFWF
jgi:hypothetical protein